jgi:SAM-dependent methyltransferase
VRGPVVGVDAGFAVESVGVSEGFYRWFSERRLTKFGSARRGRIERSRLGLLEAAIAPPGDMLEVGPGTGSLAAGAVAAGWRYRAIEASETLVTALRAKGFDVTFAWAPPIPADNYSCDVVYADQVLEHMSGIDAAREFVAESLRALRPGGVCFIVVPDYLKERAFFWDVDYTHNFVTTERRVRQLLYDGGFEVERVVRSIGVATGLARDLLAAGALLVNIPGIDALSRYTRTEDLLFRIRKNLFETLTFVARKPKS